MSYITTLEDLSHLDDLRYFNVFAYVHDIVTSIPFQFHVKYKIAHKY